MAKHKRVAWAHAVQKQNKMFENVKRTHTQLKHRLHSYISFAICFKHKSTKCVKIKKRRKKKMYVKSSACDTCLCDLIFFHWSNMRERERGKRQRRWKRQIVKSANDSQKETRPNDTDCVWYGQNIVDMCVHFHECFNRILESDENFSYFLPFNSFHSPFALLPPRWRHTMYKWRSRMCEKEKFKHHFRWPLESLCFADVHMFWAWKIR